jgi:uncharacterized FAD-dependent dehydrogenase
MLRINELKLPLDHSDDDLLDAIVNKLDIVRDKLLDFTIFKRSYDARKKSNILLIYQLDVTLTEDAEKTVLEKFAKQSFIRPSPDTSYHFVAAAPADFPGSEQQRPIIIGFWV